MMLPDHKPPVTGVAHRCDYAACNESATASSGGWSFCPKHAEDDALISAGEDPTAESPPEDLDEVLAHGTEAREKQHRREGEDPCRPCLMAAARAKMDRIQKRQMQSIPPAAPSPLARLLEDASGHSVTKVRNLAAKIEAHLDSLRALISEHDHAEHTRSEQEKAQAKVRAEVDRLEQELREARARLKGGTPRVPGRGTPRAASWTPERRAAQAERLRAVNARKRDRHSA